MHAFSLNSSWLRALCLAASFCLAPLLGGCAANYHFCPPGAAEDPSHPFAPCKATPTEQRTQ